MQVIGDDQSMNDIKETGNENYGNLGGLEQDTVFLTNTFRKALFPCILTIMSANINIFVDGVLIGKKLGENALAAINLSLPIYLVLCVIGSFIAAGTAIEAARAEGHNDDARKNRCYSTAVLSAFSVSLVMTIIGLLFRDQITGLLCSDEAIRPYVMEYIVITIIGSLPKIMIYVPFWYLRLDGKNSAVTVMMTVMSVGNIILDVIFVYPLDMGVFGAGLASVIATAAAFALGMMCMFTEGSTFRLSGDVFRRQEDWKKVAAAGTPSALNNLFATFRILIINAMLMKIGGGALVAVFTAVNGIAGFGECISLGVPQAASAMMGVFCGERDNGSCRILVRIQLVTGAVFSAVFVAICLCGSKLFAWMYGLSASLFIPLLWMSLSVFPGLICSVLSNYYNMSERNILSTLIIFFRMVVMVLPGLILVSFLHLSVFIFLLFAELSTLGVWFLSTGIYHRIHSEYSRYLLMNTELEESGRVLNFSVSSSAEDICEASERITDFCVNNGIGMKETMRIQLALEEIMTLIVRVNKEGAVPSFDLRAFSLKGVTGVRIRYSGKEFDPFNSISDDDDMFMGVMMIKKMVEVTVYRRTFGVNSLQILLEENTD